jgi:hypothetical protein
LNLDAIIPLALEGDGTQRVRSRIFGIMFSQVLIHLVVFIQHGQNVLLLGDHAVGARRRDQPLDVEFIGVQEESDH